LIETPLERRPPEWDEVEAPLERLGVAAGVGGAGGVVDSGSDLRVENIFMRVPPNGLPIS
jgi:hypothetical protein